jgi:hypothetical protein
MKKLSIAVVALVAVALLVGSSLTAGEKKESLKSGPQVGETVPGPFHPLNVTGAFAGEKNCLYCNNGNNPVAMIFARKTSKELTALIKHIDTSTQKNKDAKMGSFVVFLSDAENLAKDLKSLAEKEGIKQCVLSIDNPAGPEKYKVAKEAEVTVVLYVDHKVQANHTFRSGELNEKAIGNIVSDVKKILPK